MQTQQFTLVTCSAWQIPSDIQCLWEAGTWKKGKWMKVSAGQDRGKLFLNYLKLWSWLFHWRFLSLSNVQYLGLTQSFTVPRCSAFRSGQKYLLSFSLSKCLLLNNFCELIIPVHFIMCWLPVRFQVNVRSLPLYWKTMSILRLAVSVTASLTFYLVVCCDQRDALAYNDQIWP